MFPPKAGCAVSMVESTQAPGVLLRIPCALSKDSGGSRSSGYSPFISSIRALLQLVAQAPERTAATRIPRICDVRTPARPPPARQRCSVTCAATSPSLLDTQDLTSAGARARGGATDQSASRESARPDGGKCGSGVRVFNNGGGFYVRLHLH